eukprot:3543737-Alexandrium_andersonii.AAC.1
MQAQAQAGAHKRARARGARASARACARTVKYCPMDAHAQASRMMCVPDMLTGIVDTRSRDRYLGS